MTIHVVKESLLIESHGVEGGGELSKACIKVIKTRVSGTAKLINRTDEGVKTSLHHVVVLFGEPEGTHLWASGIHIVILPWPISDDGGFMLLFNLIFIVTIDARGGALIIWRDEGPLTIGTFNNVHFI